MKRMSEQEEERLIAATERAIKYAAAGDSATTAVIKAAREEGYNPDNGVNMAHMFNQSKTHAVFADAPLNKRADDFELVDVDEVRSALGSVKAAVELDYSVKAPSRFKPMQKAASVDAGALEGLPYLQELMSDGVKYAAADNSDLVFGAVERRRRSLRHAKSAALADSHAAERMIESRVQKAASYFLYGPVAFERAEAGYISERGAMGEKIANVVFEEYDNMSTRYNSRNRIRQAPEQKRAADADEKFIAVKLADEPYKSFEAIKEAHDALSTHAGNVHKLAAELETLEQEWKAFREKKAGLGTAGITGAISGTVGELLNSASPAQFSSPNAAGARNQIETLKLIENPALRRDLDAIRTRSKLEMLRAEDPVLAQYSEDDIYQAYNELRSVAPRALSTPTIMRAELRRYLESSTDPRSRVLDTFESGQLASIEKNLTGDENLKLLAGGRK